MLSFAVLGQTLVVRGSLNLSPRSAVACAESLAYCAGPNSFSVVSLSNPDSPALRGQTTPGAATINALAAQNGYVYAAAAGNGLVVIRVANPAAPAVAATLALQSTATSVAANDTLVAVGTINGVKLIGARDPAHPHLLTSYDAVARWVDWGTLENSLHVGTDDGVILLEIRRTVDGGDTTLSLFRLRQYGSGRMSPVSAVSPYVSLANASAVIALREADYGFAGQYAAPAAIRCLMSGSHLTMIGLATGAVQFLDQRSDVPSYVAGATLSSAPNGLAAAQSGTTKLVAAVHNGGLTVLSYTALGAPEIPEVAIAHDLLLRAYPNPFNSLVTLEMYGPHPGRFQLELYDVLGQLVEARIISLDKRATVTLDFTQRAGGWYWARLSGHRQQVVQKLLFLP